MSETQDNKKPNETGTVKVEGHILITDKTTGEVLVDKKTLFITETWRL